MPEDRPGISEDSLLDGRLRLLQLRHGHRAGTDAVLVAAAAGPLASGTIVDVGAGSGAVGLMIGARCGASIVFLERDPDLAALCRSNVEANGLQDRARVVEADILAPADQSGQGGLVPGSADMVVTNPPFLEEGSSRASPDASRAAAHQLPEGGSERWIDVCADLLKPGGRLVLIHRADRLGDCLRHIEGRFGGLVVKPIHPRADKPASRIVVTAMKGSRAPLAMAPPIVLHQSDGRFTPEAEAIHRGEMWLLM